MLKSNDVRVTTIFPPFLKFSFNPVLGQHYNSCTNSTRRWCSLTPNPLNAIAAGTNISGLCQMATQTLKEVVCWLSQSIMHEAWKHQSLIALKNRYKFFSSGITDFVVTQLQINQALIFSVPVLEFLRLNDQFC